MSLVGFKAQNHPQQTVKDAVDDRGTDPVEFAKFDAEFGPFTLDAAAAPHNTKCSTYFSIEDDGLTQSWAGHKVWCNPPYSNIGAWVQKAWDEYESTSGIVMLLPANRCEQKWWQQQVEPFRDGKDAPYSPLVVRFLPGRMRFIKAGCSSIGPNERPPFGCCLLIWDSVVSALSEGEGKQ